jgi:hypothetical protein
VSEVPEEAVTMAYAEYQRLYPQRSAAWGELAEWERERFRRVIGAAAPSLLADEVSAHRAEQDAVHADLSMLLRVLGMGDHARPQSSHEVMLDAINEVGRIRLALKRAEAIIGERDRQLAEARAQERERIARHLDALAANYPEDVFPPGAESRDGISGGAMRHAYRNAARSVREDLSEGDGNG